LGGTLVSSSRSVAPSVRSRSDLTSNQRPETPIGKQSDDNRAVPPLAKKGGRHRRTIWCMNDGRRLPSCRAVNRSTTSRYLHTSPSLAAGSGSPTVLTITSNARLGGVLRRGQHEQAACAITSKRHTTPRMGGRFGPTKDRPPSLCVARVGSGPRSSGRHVLGSCAAGAMGLLCDLHDASSRARRPASSTTPLPGTCGWRKSPAGSFVSSPVLLVSSVSFLRAYQPWQWRGPNVLRRHSQAGFNSTASRGDFSTRGKVCGRRSSRTSYSECHDGGARPTPTAVACWGRRNGERQRQQRRVEHALGRGIENSSRLSTVPSYR